MLNDRLLRPPIVAHLPEPPAGMFDIAYTVMATGMLALVRSDCDVYANHARNSMTRDCQPLIHEGARACLSLFDGKTETPVIDFLLESAFLALDQLPDGHWVIADRRGGRTGETNARLFSPGGDLVRRFRVGDAIEHLQCDDTGAIWVGYFDEALSEDFTGLIKFDSHGQVLWRSADNAFGSINVRYVGRGLWLRMGKSHYLRVVTVTTETASRLPPWVAMQQRLSSSSDSIFRRLQRTLHRFSRQEGRPCTCCGRVSGGASQCLTSLRTRNNKYLRKCFRQFP